ncbi:Tyrosine-protein kinase receptor Tie-1 [Chionoecetes opilio]|uniref:Tyrosine-protein kinase receptor Tie-1 n=1 Tax=Chionoecetes opilio TaxID=41210 RepID=A0A8J4XVG5_CHIOP|nr:Tyrosine-protein kinase receptor Tie-1 [Chionoecetes opilio]
MQFNLVCKFFHHCRGVDEGVTDSDGRVRDVSLVIKYKEVYYLHFKRFTLKPESASCMTSDLRQDLNPSVVPDNAYYDVPSTDTIDSVKKVTWSGLGESSVQGLICSAGGNQAVSGPIIHHPATLICQRLSITLNKDEDLRLPLFKSLPGKLLWQKEPWQDSAWKDGTLINHNELFIPSHQLNGSGIYKIITESANPVTSSTPGSEEYNVFSLLVQECPEHRCGLHCLEWCPDCLNGGMCDARNGECVCPPGVMGPRCQTVCPEDHIGRNCTVNVGSLHRYLVMCVGAPLGCTCAPGYHGVHCDKSKYCPAKL